MTQIEWRASGAPVDYPSALAEMEARVAAIHAGHAKECIWLLEHPPIFTAGSSADAKDLINPQGFPVYETGRGGQYTYHGPGQRVAYVMLNLAERGRDVRWFVCRLEDWIIAALGDFGIHGERRAGRVGVWVDRGHGREEKIAAVGLRVRRWVTFHGISINVAPDLSHYGGIVPCGIREHGVTSLAALGVRASMADLDAALMRHFEPIFERAACAA